MDSHYISLVSGYSSVVGLWFLLNYKFPSIWKEAEKIDFKKPFLEFIFALLTVLVILLIGQLYIQGLLIKSNGNDFLDALNQFIIFSPVFFLLLIRKQSVKTVWLSKTNIVIHLFLGLLLAFFGILIYWLTRSDSNNFTNIIINIYNYKNISHLVQVFMEDITIALVFVRLSAWIGNKRSIILVSVLFAVSHIPSFIAEGASLMQLSSLFLDTFIGVIVFFALSRSRDILWFFMVHFAMDMTQFYG